MDCAMNWRNAKVEQAQLDSAWAYKLEALLKFGRVAVLILASLLSLALIAVTLQHSSANSNAARRD